LIRIDEKLQSHLEDPRHGFEKVYGVSLGANEATAREVVSQTLAMLARAPREPVWGGYLVGDPEHGVVVGTCGFKHGPERNGSVEIAYFTFPEFEGKGYATAMARELLRMALESDGAREVIAYTLPTGNASTRILEKIGLRWSGDVVDPEDGRVWRWVYPPDATGRACVATRR
jgi:RimJ/RimL family protein N-acetyltransferase